MFTKTLEFVLVGLILFHLLLSPYTKVEESFNVQAIHDILNYGVYPREVLQNYDHVEFPGVVPRTFVGSLVVAGFVKLTDLVYSLFAQTSFVADMNQGQLHVQVIARAVLGLANVFGIVSLRRSLDKISGRSKLLGFFYTLMFLSQFHILFYATRTLPNFIALPMVNYALSKILLGDMSGLSWLAFCGVVFRLEVGIFAVVIALVSSLIFGQSNIFSNFMYLAVSSCVGAVVSGSIDSYFWGHSVLPELSAFLFNVVEGKLVEWGIEPYTTYFVKYIPNFFRPPHVLFLCLFGLMSDPARAVSTESKQKNKESPRQTHNSLRILSVSALLYVATMSFQPHKEWRFIVYTIPIFNALAGNGLLHLWNGLTKLNAHKILFVLMIASTVVAFAISSFMSFASSYNYPGGQAINWVNNYGSPKLEKQNILVHMDVPACMTGITRFTQLSDERITYDKTETDAALALIWKDVNILITHKNLDVANTVSYDVSKWQKVKEIPAFSSVRGLRFVKDVVDTVKNLDTRTHLITAILSELKEARFDSFQAFIEKSITLQTYLRVYERVAQEDKRFENSKVINDSTPENGKDDLVIGDIDPNLIEAELNNQIDSLENDEVTRFIDEL